MKQNDYFRNNAMLTICSRTLGKEKKMAKRINFFATKNDMITVLSKVEEQLSYGVKYIQCGKADWKSYGTVKDIPGLGMLKDKHCEISFLIMREEDEVRTNQFGQVYQGENSCSLEFDPSGISEDGTGLIHGMYAIMEDNETAVALLNAVKKNMKSECQKSKGWYIGKEAEGLYGKLRFICIGLSEPEIYDFKIAEQT